MWRSKPWRTDDFKLWTVTQYWTVFCISVWSSISKSVDIEFQTEMWLPPGCWVVPCRSAWLGGSLRTVGCGPANQKYETTHPSKDFCTKRLTRIEPGTKRRERKVPSTKKLKTNWVWNETSRNRCDLHPCDRHVLRRTPIHASSILIDNHIVRNLQRHTYALLS